MNHLQTLTAETAPNLAETLAREMKEPVKLIEYHEHNSAHYALPPGWRAEHFDDSHLLPQPLRKAAKAAVDDVAGFIDYINRHKLEGHSTIWCKADYTTGKVSLLSIIDDHGPFNDSQRWRDHTVSFEPRMSEEWKRWTGMNKKAFSQIEFAAFIEENLKDIATQEGFPTAAQMLEMAVSMEINQDVRFKSAIRLQSGGVQLNYVDKDNEETIQKMQMFERFSLGIPAFWNGSPYRLDARLRYRMKEGACFFYYELIRHDLVLQAATNEMIQTIRDKTGLPFFFGSPGA